jgi:hypothetical protein
MSLTEVQNKQTQQLSVVAARGLYVSYGPTRRQNDPAAIK